MGYLDFNRFNLSLIQNDTLQALQIYYDLYSGSCQIKDFLTRHKYICSSLILQIINIVFGSFYGSSMMLPNENAISIALLLQQNEALVTHNKHKLVLKWRLCFTKSELYIKRGN